MWIGSGAGWPCGNAVRDRLLVGGAHALWIISTARLRALAAFLDQAAPRFNGRPQGSPSSILVGACRLLIGLPCLASGGPLTASHGPTVVSPSRCNVPKGTRSSGEQPVESGGSLRLRSLSEALPAMRRQPCRREASSQMSLVRLGESVLEHRVPFDRLYRRPEPGPLPRGTLQLGSQRARAIRVRRPRRALCHHRMTA